MPPARLASTCRYGFFGSAAGPGGNVDAQAASVSMMVSSTRPVLVDLEIGVSLAIGVLLT